MRFFAIGNEWKEKHNVLDVSAADSRATQRGSPGMAIDSLLHGQDPSEKAEAVPALQPFRRAAKPRLPAPVPTAEGPEPAAGDDGAQDALEARAGGGRDGVADGRRSQEVARLNPCNLRHSEFSNN